jgi:hypothetical protein
MINDCTTPGDFGLIAIPIFKSAAGRFAPNPFNTQKTETLKSKNNYWGVNPRRNPKLMSRAVGSLLPRFEARSSPGSPRQEPPRKTFDSSLLGPCGFSLGLLL